MVLLLAFAFVVAACGDDDSSSDDGGDEPQTEETTSDDAETDDAESDEGEASGGASSMTFDGEVIALDALGCYSEEQEVAGSIMTLTAQASGTNAAGENVIVDFTRFAPGGAVGESDDILIDIGPLTDSKTYQANLPFESIAVVDGVLTVEETTFRSFDDNTEVTVSVAIVC